MSSKRDRAADGSLPSGFTSIRDALDGKLVQSSMVNMAGIVTDFRAPIPTQREDWKCGIRFFDSSVEDDEDASITLNLFRPQNEMPHDVGCGDVILIHGAKLQRFRGSDWSLLSNHTTRLHFYKAADIPKPPDNASKALRPLARSKDGVVGMKEHVFISAMFHKTNKDRVPDAQIFETMQITSTNVKEKFSLLKDVREGQFCDLIGRVVKAPYDMGNKMMLWVSDFTDNPAFYHFALTDTDLAEGRDGDPYNYTAKLTKFTAKSDWNGPFGKRSIQITCFEPHATAIRGRIISGNWVSIRNLQIKFGHSGVNLEGFLREDRGAQGIKIGIQLLDPTEDAGNMPRLKAAVQRMRDYERAKRGQLKDIKDAAKAGQKRKDESTSEKPAKKSKLRNNKKRHRAQPPEQPPEQPPQEQSEREPLPAAPSLPAVQISAQVKCENQTRPVSTIADMVEPVFQTFTIEGKTVRLRLPFANLNYRANVRVVDFMPSNLAEFTFPKKSSEYSCLSDNDDSDFQSDSDHDMMTDFAAVRDWEWQFYLQLEDAAVPPNQDKKRVWVLVDNSAAQCLLNLDASNLRHNKEDLDRLRKTLSVLWGDLEEHKRNEKVTKADRALGDLPPPDSDDEEGPVSKDVGEKKAGFSSRPFPCCIQQYGVNVPEEDIDKADAGRGRRWQRVFGMFGTRIIGGPDN